MTLPRPPNPARRAARRSAAGLAIALGMLASSALAQTPPAATLEPAQSQLQFVSRQMGVPVEGQFRRFDAQIAFDPKQPASGRIAFTVDLGSATLGVAETDAELRKPAWFDVGKFPQARFTSSAIKALGGGRFEVAGQLSIKGRAQPLTVPVTLSQAGGLSTASGQFSIKRLAFQIGSGEWGDPSLVADEVQVRFKFALRGVPPS